MFCNYKLKILLIIFFFGLFLSPFNIFSQTTQVQFGQNRVQYHPFDWQYYNSDNFTIYFYPGGQEIGKFVWTTAEMKLKELDKQMDFHFHSQVDILVYNDISDLAQTNIGLGKEDYNIGGTAILRDNKLFFLWTAYMSLTFHPMLYSTILRYRMSIRYDTNRAIQEIWHFEFSDQNFFRPSSVEYINQISLSLNPVINADDFHRNAKTIYYLLG